MNIWIALYLNLFFGLLLFSYVVFLFNDILGQLKLNKSIRLSNIISIRGLLGFLLCLIPLFNIVGLFILISNKEKYEEYIKAALLKGV